MERLAVGACTPDLPTWLVTSWKRGLLATRVGEASHPGPSDILGAALWEGNPNNDQASPDSTCCAQEVVNNASPVPSAAVTPPGSCTVNTTPEVP